jgi:Cytochrome c
MIWTSRLLVYMLFASGGICAAQDLNSIQQGKNIYRGLSKLAQIPTIQNVAMPSNITACSSCHGLSGQGKKEAGIVVPSITLKALLLPSAGGKAFSSVQEALVGLSTGTGRQNANRPIELSANMPRYQFTPQELLELAAYISVLGTQQDDPAGVSSNAIRVGTILPTEKVIKLVGKEIETGLQSEINAINLRGGIYGRKIELVIQPLNGMSKVDYIEGLKILSAKEIFALVGTWQPPFQMETIANVPLIASLGFAATQVQARTQHYLMPSLQDQLKELLKHTASECGSTPNELLLLHNGHAPTVEALAQIDFQSQTDIRIVKVDVDSHAESFVDPKIRRVVALGVPIDKLTQFKPQVRCTAQLAALSGLPIEHDKGSVKQLTLLPIPQSLAQTNEVPFWSTMGHIAVKLLADSLSRSGRQLDEQSLQLVFETVDKFDLSPEIQIGYARHTVPGFRSSLMMSGGSYASIPN